MPTAFIFSGQGSQYEGMGEDLYNKYSTAKKIYDQAREIFTDEILNFKLGAGELALTKHAQPAIFTLGIAVNSVLTERGIRPDAVAGFSLGECTALCAAGVIGLSDAMNIIKHRSAVMQEAAETSNGGMCAIIGLDAEKIESICKSSPFSSVIPVNYNSPVQTVIAGEKSAVKDVAAKCIQAGAAKAVDLAVNAAFHSPMMEKASQNFRSLISEIQFNDANTDIYSNITGTKINDFSDIPSYLALQMISPVRWTDVVTEMARNGVDTVIELGPGKVLTGLVRRIDKSIRIFNIEDAESLESVIDKL